MYLEVETYIDVVCYLVFPTTDVPWSNLKCVLHICLHINTQVPFLFVDVRFTGLGFSLTTSWQYKLGEEIVVFSCREKKILHQRLYGLSFKLSLLEVTPF